MPETIIKKERGEDLKSTKYAFCGYKVNIKIFGVEAGERFDGIVFKHFGVCEEHLSKINALLSGEFDIDRIDLERYRKVHVGRGLRLRNH